MMINLIFVGLSYEEQHGRESLLEMLNIIFHKLPEVSLAPLVMNHSISLSLPEVFTDPCHLFLYSIVLSAHQ